MPNWCSNSILVSHESKEVLAGLIEAFKQRKFCDHIAPMPDELRSTTAPVDGSVGEKNIEKYGHSDWYDFATSEWGIKWDVGDEEDFIITDDVGCEVVFTFDSPWGPPTALYHKMEKLGYKVDAFYSESACGFCGRWIDGEDHYYDWGMEQEDFERFLESVENDEHFQAINDEFGIIADIRSSFEEEEQ